MRDMYGTIRQLYYPKEFRILPGALGDDLKSVEEGCKQIVREVGKVVEMLETGGGSVVTPDSPDVTTGTPDSTAESTVEKEYRSLLADLATGLWRLRYRMLKPGSEDPIEGMEKPYRYLESAWSTLTRAKVEIQDHIGKPYYPGMARAIAFEPKSGYTREMVIETLRPTIYLKGKSIQVGQVIVATPEE